METARTLSVAIWGVKPAKVYRKLNLIGYQRDQQKEETPLGQGTDDDHFSDYWTGVDCVVFRRAGRRQSAHRALIPAIR
jgi:hypothetical protein